VHSRMKSARAYATGFGVTTLREDTADEMNAPVR
jgi:hypothetical protein